MQFSKVRRLWKRQASVPCGLFFVTMTVLSLLLSSPLLVDAGDYRFNSGDGNSAGTAVDLEANRKDLNSAGLFGRSGVGPRVTCERRVTLGTGNASEQNIWIPFNPKTYDWVGSSYLRVTANEGTCFIRPFYRNVSDTTFVAIISADSVTVGWSTRADVDSLRLWSDTDGDWVTIYVE